MTQYYTDQYGRQFPACPCQLAWLPVFISAAKSKGLISSLHLYQLIGNAPQSGGVHATGGAIDFEPRNLDNKDALIALADELGGKFELRLKSQGFSLNHIHGLLRGCPHMSPGARAQMIEFDQDNQDGLADHAPDYGPTGIPRRTWQQGIQWWHDTHETLQQHVNDIIGELARASHSTPAGSSTNVAIHEAVAALRSIKY